MGSFDRSQIGGGSWEGMEDVGLTRGHVGSEVVIEFTVWS